MLATSGLGADISIWALPSGEQIGTLSGHEMAVGTLTFTSDGQQLVSLGHEGAIKFWRTDDWTEVRMLEADGSGLRGFALSPDEHHMALRLPRKVQVRSVADWAVVADLPIRTQVVSGVAFSPDERWLAASTADGKIRVWGR
jgi:WD40 repeat protein